jgi:hypothetical protein
MDSYDDRRSDQLQKEVQSKRYQWHLIRIRK